MGPASSKAVTAKVSLRPSTAVSSASAHTFMPTGVAASWLTSRWVPTVPSPSFRPAWTALTAAFSIRAIIWGVANTGSRPLPTAAAVFSSVTTHWARPLAPTCSDMGMLLSGCSEYPYFTTSARP